MPNLKILILVECTLLASEQIRTGCKYTLCQAFCCVTGSMVKSTSGVHQQSGSFIPLPGTLSCMSGTEAPRDSMPCACQLMGWWQGTTSFGPQTCAGWQNGDDHSEMSLGFPLDQCMHCCPMDGDTALYPCSPMATSPNSALQGIACPGIDQGLSCGLLMTDAANG